ncbi:MAG: hypothetical protein AB7N65_23050 [Vicinamibacterales bacterium]
MLAFPYRGRPAKKDGTRELMIASLPWLVVYTVSDDVIDDVINVVRGLCGAQRWPGSRTYGRGRNRPARVVVSGQWRAMRDGNPGTHGSDGNLVSVSYRFRGGDRVRIPASPPNKSFSIK